MSSDIDFAELDPGLACCTDGVHLSGCETLRQGPSLPNGAAGAGVTFRVLFRWEEAALASLCGHHTAEPLDLIVAPTHDHAPEILRADVERPRSRHWRRQRRRRRWRARHGRDAEEVGFRWSEEWCAYHHKVKLLRGAHVRLS